MIHLSATVLPRRRLSDPLNHVRPPSPKPFPHHHRTGRATRGLRRTFSASALVLLPSLAGCESAAPTSVMQPASGANREISPIPPGGVTVAVATPLRQLPYWGSELWPERRSMGGVGMWPTGAVVPSGKYRIHARVSGFVYRGPHGHYACGMAPTRFGPGGVPDPQFRNRRILAAQVVLTRKEAIDRAENPNPELWKILPLSPASPDSSVYEGETMVLLSEPYAVTFWRGSGVSEFWFCESAWRTDQTITVTITPASDGPAQQPSLALACTGDLGANRVTRGQEIRCRVYKSDADAQGSVSVGEWRFDRAARRDGDKTSSEWEGVMVKGGIVEVRARVGTSPEQTLAATIDVVDRDWVGKAPYTEVEVVSNGDDARLLLSRSVIWAHDLGGVNFFPVKDPSTVPSDPVGDVRSGPNYEMYYYTDLTFYSYALVVLNRDVMRGGSRFYLAQEPDRPGSGSGSRLGNNWCDRSYVSSGLEAAVRQHEIRHVEVYKIARTRELAEVIRRLETVTDTASSDMYDQIAAEYLRAGAIAQEESRRVVDAKNGADALHPRDSQGPCTLRNEAGAELTNKEN